MEGKGIKAPGSVIETREKHIMQSIGENGGIWKKYDDQLVKSLGITREKYFDTYYRRYLEYEYYADQYLKSVKVLKFGEKQIDAIMNEKGVCRDNAIEILKNEFVWNQLFDKENELRKKAKAEIVNIKAINNLKNYFNFGN